MVKNYQWGDRFHKVNPISSVFDSDILGYIPRSKVYWIEAAIFMQVFMLF